MNKHNRFNEMICSGNTVLVVLDPRYESVLVPERFSKQETLALHLGLNTRLPITDLMMDEAGFSATLSFAGKLHQCYISWEAVKSMSFEHNNMGYSWDVAGPKQPEKPLKQKGHLRLVVNNG